MSPPPSAVVFDLGGVLIDWDPRYLYRTLFPGDEAAMEAFLATVCTPDWNAEQDAGRTWAEAEVALVAKHPAQRALIQAFRERWVEMLGGPIAGTVAIVAELRSLGVPIYALTNWSAETFPIAYARYDFLGWFRGIVVSGQERMRKPDARIYRILLERYGLKAADTLFIDDIPAYLDGAASVGLRTLRFQGADPLREGLVERGLLPVG